MIKKDIQHLLKLALEALQQTFELETFPPIKVEAPRQSAHGDYASNIALLIAKQVQRQPREAAELIIRHLPQSETIKHVEIAGPGFINFFVADRAYHRLIHQILEQKYWFGRAESQKPEKIHLEFVSANPTGPLHVGHGRNAAYGASLGNLLEAVGYQVHREYYVNDAGRQIHILALSIWLRYLSLFEHHVPFPDECYQGDYIINIAETLRKEAGEHYQRPIPQLTNNLPHQETNPDRYIDALIERMQTLLGEDDYHYILTYGVDIILQSIKDDLTEFGIEFQTYYRESELIKQNAVQHGIEVLRDHHCLYERNGATWFRSTSFGDEKDRVVIRDNGQTTYFASDIAYHLNKFERGFDALIDVLGADHHGYIPRIKAFLKALDGKDQNFYAKIVQLVSLYRGQQKLSMSTRGGKFVTLRELYEEVGRDAARYFYIMHKPEQHLDFDLELAKSQTADNPVYYIQYAHARICSVYRQLEQRRLQWHPEQGLAQLDLLNTGHERRLMWRLGRYPEVIESAAYSYEPHELANYLEKCANDFHTYYNAHQFLVEDEALRNARLSLISATRQIISNGLGLLGVFAPETM